MVCVTLPTCYTEAKAALAADPENVQLQKLFKKFESDMWGTPPILARATVEVCAELMRWNWDTSFCEPCAGAREFVYALQYAGFFNGVAYEIDTLQTNIKMDCLDVSWSTNVTIGNPPFSNWQTHILHYREQSPQVVQVLKMQAVLEVTTRCELRAVDGPLRNELRYVFPLPRIKFIPLVGQKGGTDSMSTAVFVWERGYTGNPEISYNIARRMAVLQEVEG